MLELPELIAQETGRPKVLVIDDEFGPRESVSFLLQGEFEVFAADRVDRGLEMLVKDSFAVVIMDIRMPQKNGIEGLEELRKLDTDVSVIMLTGYAALNSAQAAISLGANEYMRKPFDVEAMLQSVRRHAKDALERKKRKAVLKQVDVIYESIKREQKTSQAQIGYGQAAAEMVHDLCNPLVVAIGYSQLMLMETRRLKERFPSEIEKVNSYAETLEKCSSFCLHLAESWRQSSKNVTQFESIDLRSAADEVKKVLFFDLPRVEVLGESGVLISGSRYELIRVLQNLVKNALESDASHVVVKIQSLDGKAQLSISDNGKGIPPEMVEIILKKPVATTKEHGTGLGMTIVRHIVAAHRGEMNVESRIGEGTTFTIEFPLS